MLWAHVEITHHSLEPLNDWSAIQSFLSPTKKVSTLIVIVAGVLQSGTVVLEMSVTTIDVQSVKQFGQNFMVFTANLKQSILNFLFGILRFLRCNLEE